MFSRLSRLRLLSVLLTLVLVAPPLGGRLPARLGAQAASSQTSGTTNELRAVACPRPSTCVAVGDHGVAVTGTLLRTMARRSFVRVCAPHQRQHTDSGTRW
jgi:hypothetical protein